MSTWALRTNGDTPSGFAKDRTDRPALRRRAGPRRSRRSRLVAQTRGTCGKASQAGTGPSGSGPSGSGPSGSGPSGNGASGSEASGNEANDKRPRLRPECGGSGGAQLKALVQLGAERELARRIRQRYHLRPPASNAMSGGSPHRHRHSQASACAIRAHNAPGSGPHLSGHRCTGSRRRPHRDSAGFRRAWVNPARTESYFAPPSSSRLKFGSDNAPSASIARPAASIAPRMASRLHSTCAADGDVSVSPRLFPCPPHSPRE